MTEREQLLEEAKSLGLTFANNAKIDNIKKAIKKARSESVDVDETMEKIKIEEGLETEAEMRERLEKEFKEKLEKEKQAILENIEKNMEAEDIDVAKGVRTSGQRKMDARKEATKLVRVNIIPKDPMKQNWEGEIISVGNDSIGEIKKYVAFNTEEGYHIPQIILNVLKDKECTIFVNKKINGQTVKVGKQIKAYGIEYLEPLTEEELRVLAADQLARRAID